MRELLAILPKPSRYVGTEEGSVQKDPASTSLRIGLAFPDMYEVGMSYLGQKILYGLVNSQPDHPDWWAERVFTPCEEAGAILRDHKAPLCTLESDTPLGELDVLGFSVTHELCYTNLLYTLDLAGIPLWSSERSAAEAVAGRRLWPIITAGGGCTLGAEPLAPFVDLMFLGEGEEVLLEFLQILEKGKNAGWGRSQILQEARKLPGVYVPEFFEVEEGSGITTVKPLFDDYTSVKRRVVADVDKAFYPVRQSIPFGAVHNRLALEIGRGCTRGCRFCQAGIVYRPSRERSVKSLETLLDDCLRSTGYDDVSFLSLSSGDFSALKTLFHSALTRCSAEQVSVSLPSLRVGSIDDSIMQGMAGIRRTGATLAPEAGSQRLRDVINKGITEEELILHVQKLFEHGWQQIKLYFMIGLPTETDEDLLAIMELAQKVRDAAGPGIKRLQVTVSVSPYVPKAHTPFQWEGQISLEEIRRRVGVLLNAVKGQKRIKLRWHEPDMSFLEGIFSRGDRRLAKVVESAYRKGAIFTNWMDKFKLAPWLEAMQENGLDPLDYTGARGTEEALPWQHLKSGVSDEFLLKERERSFEGKVTQDCRYDTCRFCGVCDTKAGPSGLDPSPDGLLYSNRLNFPERDQAAHKPSFDEYGRVIVKADAALLDEDDSLDDENIVADVDTRPTKGKSLPPKLQDGLAEKAMHLRIWYSKEGGAVYLSQLELQSVFDRAMRRANLPLSFSQGFHPMPLISFARALSVGVASRCEWFSLYIRERMDVRKILESLNKGLPSGLAINGVEELPIKIRPVDSIEEKFLLQWISSEERRPLFEQAWEALAGKNELLWTKESKKAPKNNKVKADKVLNLRDFFVSFGFMSGSNSAVVAGVDPNGGAAAKTDAFFGKILKGSENSGHIFTLSWDSGYLSPLLLCRLALNMALGMDPDPANNPEAFAAHEFLLTKLEQN